jgi:hypothetical protein
MATPVLASMNLTDLNTTPTSGLETADLLFAGQTRSWLAWVNESLNRVLSRTESLVTEPAGLPPAIVKALQIWNTRREISDPVDPTTRRHAGIAAVGWLCSNLSIARDRALRIAHVPQATYYSWVAKSDTVVRPKSVEHLLRVTSSLKLLESALGPEMARLVLTSGSPSLLDQLEDTPADAEAALHVIGERSQPQIAAPLNRVTDTHHILASLRRLDAISTRPPDPDPLGPATPLSQGEAELFNDDASDEPESPDSEEK